MPDAWLVALVIAAVLVTLCSLFIAGLAWTLMRKARRGAMAAPVPAFVDAPLPRAGAACEGAPGCGRAPTVLRQTSVDDVRRLCPACAADPAYGGRAA